MVKSSTTEVKDYSPARQRAQSQELTVLVRLDCQNLKTMPIENLGLYW